MCIMNGTIKEFDIEKGYGFITTEEYDDIFFHYTEVITKGKKKLKKGDLVTFKPEKKSKEIIAKKVMKKY